MGSPHSRDFLQDLTEASGAFLSSVDGSSGFRDLGYVFANERGANSHAPHPDHPGHFTCADREHTIRTWATARSSTPRRWWPSIRWLRSRVGAVSTSPPRSPIHMLDTRSVTGEPTTMYDITGSVHDQSHQPRRRSRLAPVFNDRKPGRRSPSSTTTINPHVHARRSSRIHPLTDIPVTVDDNDLVDNRSSRRSPIRSRSAAWLGPCRYDQHLRQRDDDGADSATVPRFRPLPASTSPPVPTSVSFTTTINLARAPGSPLHPSRGGLSRRSPPGRRRQGHVDTSHVDATSSAHQHDTTRPFDSSRFTIH